MKNFLIIFCIALLPFSATIATTGGKAKATITSIKQDDKMVAFAITANKKFYTGGNRYILHIGGKQFFRNRQSYSKGKGQIVFYIPIDDFNMLNDDTKVFLTYGGKDATEDEMEDMSRHDSNTYWSLGAFSKSLLSK